MEMQGKGKEYNPPGSNPSYFEARDSNCRSHQMMLLAHYNISVAAIQLQQTTINWPFMSFYFIPSLYINPNIVWQTENKKSIRSCTIITFKAWTISALWPQDIVSSTEFWFSINFSNSRCNVMETIIVKIAEN